MPTIEIDKSGDSIVLTTDGIVNRRSVVRADTVVSYPPTEEGKDYRKVFNIYVDADTEKLVITYYEA